MARLNDWINRMRLASGLVLFSFLATHLLNHALGLIGLDAMEAGRTVFMAVWGGLPGTVLLTAAITTHLSLVLLALLRRRIWRSVRVAEVAQIVLGLSIPPLVVYHVITTKGLNLAFDVNTNYAYVLLSLWLYAPLLGVLQAILVLVAWAHGCIGVYFWLRLKPWFGRVVAYLYGGALLLPALSLAGFAGGAREAVLRARDPIWAADFRANLHFPGPVAADWALAWRDGAYWAMAGIMLAMLVLWTARRWWEHRQVRVTITYPQGRKVQIRPGTSVLEASRSAGIPHASVCGGRGRCSTCRVRVGLGADALVPPSADEAAVLARIHAPERVRLACQIRPTRDLSVMPLLPASAQARAGHRAPDYLQGSEREIAILFADLRAFTKFAEQKLPYDVVFVINQYFRAMGQAVEHAGGHLDKFIGDGVMALFGLKDGSATGCRQALAAAAGMAEALQQLNTALLHDLQEPLRIGIGLHAGTVIVGEMGYGRASSVTAIGDAVNTSSRLEGLTKGFGAQLVVSRRVAKRAGVDLRTFPRREIEVRGRLAPMMVYVVQDALALRPLLAADAAMADRVVAADGAAAAPGVTPPA